VSELDLSRCHFRHSNLVIIDDLNIKSMTVTLPETDPALLVDPNAVLALPIVFQSLQLIRARNRKILQVSSRIQLLQFHQRAAVSSAPALECRAGDAWSIRDSRPSRSLDLERT
jgi:hypothetical protein